MKLAFCLFEYFPYGGLQKDCLRIAERCVEQGASVDILTREWEGDKPHDILVELLPTRGLSNAAKVKRFAKAVEKHQAQKQYDALIGFSKMPGLDVYYAADPCFAARAAAKYSAAYRLTNHYRTYAAFEKSVFDKDAATNILLISPKEQALYQQHYQTPDERIHHLPPGVLRDRCAPMDYAVRRAEQRDRYALDPKRKLILFIGSGFKTKGLDRAIEAFAALPSDLAKQSEFWVVGQDNPEPYQKLAKKLNCHKELYFLGGRDDISELLMSADVLIHPAYSENTGTVLLESMVAGLPVITTEACGYAHYVEEAQGGIVLPAPFEQAALNHALCSVLRDPEPYRDNGIRFGMSADIYSSIDRAQEIIFEVVKKRAC